MFRSSERRQNRFGFGGQQQYYNPYSYGSSVDAMYGGYDNRGWHADSWQDTQSSQQRPQTQEQQEDVQAQVEEISNALNNAVEEATLSLDGDDFEVR